MSRARIFVLFVALAAGFGLGAICVSAPSPAIAGGGR
jgi:hypothetical protein